MLRLTPKEGAVDSRQQSHDAVRSRQGSASPAAGSPHPASSSSSANILTGGEAGRGHLHPLHLRFSAGLHPHSPALVFLPSQSGRFCCLGGWAPWCRRRQGQSSGAQQPCSSEGLGL